ncbi:unnamed protein product [Victoria cruziana]
MHFSTFLPSSVIRACRFQQNIEVDCDTGYFHSLENFLHLFADNDQQYLWLCLWGVVGLYLMLLSLVSMGDHLVSFR